MPRPIKKGIEYFPHDTNLSGKTMFTLESRYGNDGYAFWFKLLELLGNQEGLYYDCRSEPEWMFLIAWTRVAENIAEDILGMLARLGAIDPELWKSKVIWCQHFVDRVESVFKKRGTQTPLRPDICDGNSAVPVIPGTESTQSKVKESKANKIISVPDGTGDEYSVLFEHYLSLGLIEHKRFTPEMRSAIDTARRRCGYSWDELKTFLDRHAYIVMLTEGQGQFAVEKRGVTEFFGQKVKGGTALICSEYEDDGAKWIRYKNGLPKEREAPRNRGTLERPIVNYDYLAIDPFAEESKY